LNQERKDYILTILNKIEINIRSRMLSSALRMVREVSELVRCEEAREDYEAQDNIA
jgi:hypothetical protein